MSYKVLHIIDCFLPETMNWLEKLLEESCEECEHHIFASFYIKPQNCKFQYVNSSIKTAYPISFVSKIKDRFLNSVNSKMLLNYVQGKKIQLIHFHFGHVAIKYKGWIQRTGMPFCISLYGFDFEHLVYKRPQTKADYVFLAKLGGRFIVEGNYSKRLIKNYGVPLAQVYIVHMLYERQKEQFGNGLKISKYLEPIRLLQAATFTEKKNQLGLIQALKERHASRFVISFYGEPYDKKYFTEVLKASKSNSKHNIQIYNKVSLNEYLEILSDTHFCINLSKRSLYHDTEGGCPVFLKDSLSMGKPAISTNHCDIPELIVNEFNGFLLPENEPDAVSNLLDNLLHLSQKDYIKYCRNSIESVKTNIEQNITRRDLIRVYQSML